MPKRKGSSNWTRGAILPAIGVLTVIAAGFGLHLGDSAVGAIDPIYRRGAAPIVQDRSAHSLPPAPVATYASASGWEEGQLALAHDCGADCPALRAREAGIAPSSLGIGEVAALPQPPRPYSEPPMLPEQPTVTADSAPAARTNRYLHYPVSSEPEAAPPTFSDPPPSPAAATGTRGEPDGM